MQESAATTNEPATKISHPTAVPESNGEKSKPVQAPKKSHGELWVVAAIAAVAVGAYFYYPFTKAGEPAQAAAAPAPEVKKSDPNLVKIEDKQKDSVVLQTVEAKDFQAEQVCTGKIAFNDDLTTPVFAEYTGRVTKVFFKPGDNVAKGDPLYEIDTPDLVQVEADLIAAVANLRKAQNALNLAKHSETIAQHTIDISGRNLKLAQMNQDRQKLLVDDKIVAQKDYEQAQRDLQQVLRDGEQAQKDLEQAQSDSKSAESDIYSNEHALNAIRERLRVFGKSEKEIETIQSDRVLDRITRVRAPIAGTITSRKVSLGQYIKPDNADPLFTISDLSSMWLVADVYEVDAPHVRAGDTVEVELLAYPGETFKGTVAYISPSVNPDTRRVTVRCTIANEARRLKSEMYASFRILTGENKPTPSVTGNSVVREGDKDVVYVAKSDLEFVKRTVVTGRRKGTLIQILEGLKEGERVVSDGAIFLNNNDSN